MTINAIMILFFVIALMFLGAAIIAISKRDISKLANNLAMGLCFFSLAAFVGTFALSLRGYQRLTFEELALAVQIQTIDEGRFYAHVEFPGKDKKTFEITGDQLYVDAQIVKWKPIGNLFGLHTSYHLDRIGGRFNDIEEEKKNNKSVHSLAPDGPWDLKAVREKFSFLKMFYDAQYGSASFIKPEDNVRYGLMVSTSGLLLREINVQTNTEQQ